MTFLTKSFTIEITEGTAAVPEVPAVLARDGYWQYTTVETAVPSPMHVSSEPGLLKPVVPPVTPPPVIQPPETQPPVPQPPVPQPPVTQPPVAKPSNQYIRLASLTSQKSIPALTPLIKAIEQAWIDEWDLIGWSKLWDSYLWQPAWLTTWPVTQYGYGVSVNYVRYMRYKIMKEAYMDTQVRILQREVDTKILGKPLGFLDPQLRTQPNVMWSKETWGPNDYIAAWDGIGVPGGKPGVSFYTFQGFSPDDRPIMRVVLKG